MPMLIIRYLHHIATYISFRYLINVTLWNCHKNCIIFVCWKENLNVIVTKFEPKKVLWSNFCCNLHIKIMRNDICKVSVQEIYRLRPLRYTHLYCVFLFIGKKARVNILWHAVKYISFSLHNQKGAIWN